MERLLDETEHPMTSFAHQSNAGGVLSLPPIGHSAALQQHLVDLRVTRSQNLRHRTHNNYSPTNDYSGICDAKFVLTLVCSQVAAGEFLK